jgi:hypothetical protein
VTLEEHVAACARDTGLTVGRSAPAVVSLRQVLGDDPDMQAAARRMIAAGLAIEPRDHITRWRSDLLRRALGESPNV